MTTHKVTLYNAQAGHSAWVDLWGQCKALLMAGHRLHVSVKTETRSLEQNALMWSCLTDLSRQVDWPVDGRLQKIAPEDWKHILSAGTKQAQRVAQGIEGGFVMLGQSTSKMTKGEMVELIELAHHFGDSRGVVWSRTSLGRDWPEELTA